MNNNCHLCGSSANLCTHCRHFNHDKRLKSYYKTSPVKEKAFESSVDYKPLCDDLRPDEYYRKGFEDGYKRAAIDFVSLSRKEQENLFND